MTWASCLFAILILGLVLIGGWLLVREEAGAPVDDMLNSQMLEKNGGREVEAEDVVYFKDARGYFARPSDEGTYPGVVMIHEWWGLNDNIKNMARELAKEGYQVLAVDLYGGEVATTSEDAQKLRNAILPSDAVLNLRGAAAYLRGAQSSKVASLGWCFGGGQSLALSLSGEKLDATVIYYGSPLVTEAGELQKISWPVLGIFGETDQSIPVTTVNAFDTALTSLGVSHQIAVYPGVGHAFANPSGQNYAPEETKDAWGKTLAFLEENLKK